MASITSVFRFFQLSSIISSKILLCFAFALSSKFWVHFLGNLLHIPPDFHYCKKISRDFPDRLAVLDVLHVTHLDLLQDALPSSGKSWQSLNGGRLALFFKRQARFMQTSFRMSVPGTSPVIKDSSIPGHLKHKKTVPDASPPSSKDIDLLYQFFDKSNKLVVVTGAGMSTECGIPDYRSPNGAYSSGYKPLTHQEGEVSFFPRMLLADNRRFGFSCSLLEGAPDT